MRNPETEKLIKKSKIETSTDFTDNLISRIEEEKALKNKLAGSYKWILAGLIIFSMIISFIFLKITGESFRLFPFNLKVSRTPLFVIITLIFLYAINYWLSLQSELRTLKSGKKGIQA